MSRWPVRLALATLTCAPLACGPPGRGAQMDPESRTLTESEIRAEAREAAGAAYSEGVYRREQGDFAGALQAYGDAVQLAPGSGYVRLAYARLLVEMGRMGEAAAFMRDAISPSGGSAAEHLFLARLELLDGASDSARACVDSALARDPWLAEAWFLRARMWLESGADEAALTSFQRADSLQPNDPPTLEGLAESARRLGKLAVARSALERALRLDPTLQSARRNLAGVYRREGRTEDAKRIVLQGLEVDPDDLGRLEAALETLVESGDLETAARMLRPYAERHALNPRLAYLYGRVLLQLDRLASADSVLRPLSGVEGLRGIETLLGDIAARQDRPAEAREHYRKAVAEQPDDCVPYASLALLEARARGRRAPPDARGADSTLAAAVRRTGPESYRCNLVLALVYLAEKRWEDAIPHLEATHKLDPENREVLFDLAVAHEELGNPAAALQHSRQLLRLDPENAPALNFVGYLLAELGQELPESERLVRKALEKEPGNGYYVDSLGWVLYQKGDYAGAAGQLERAVRLTKENDALILEHLGDAYVKLDRLADAQRVYGRSQSLDPSRNSLVPKLAALEAKLGKP